MWNSIRRPQHDNVSQHNCMRDCKEMRMSYFTGRDCIDVLGDRRRTPNRDTANMEIEGLKKHNAINMVYTTLRKPQTRLTNI